MKEQTLARNLAAFSLALGAAQLLAPRKVARLIGVSEDHTRTLQALGLREIASGLGIMQGNTGYFLWSRVAGDIMNLALLGVASKSDQSDKPRVHLAMAAVSGIAILDVIASALASRSHSEPGWRVNDGRGYQAGISREDPIAARAATDDTLKRYAGGHEWDEAAQPAGNSARRPNESSTRHSAD